MEIKENIFSLYNNEVNIKIKIPEKILKLIIIISSGWHYKKDQNNLFDLEISFKNNNYIIKSTHFPRFKKKIQSDIVSLINEILIFISYYYVYINKHLQLIHCSSLKLDKKNILIFGKHNIGKSTFCAYQSIKKNTIIYGDDLLLHDTKKAVFKSLGFPIRLRRPIDKKIINNFDKSKIVAGKKLAYIATNFFNSKNSGHTFEIDQFYELLKNSYLKSIKIIDVYKTLKKHTIDIYKK